MNKLLLALALPFLCLAPGCATLPRAHAGVQRRHLCLRCDAAAWARRSAAAM
jgi:hypothetical protein